MFNKIYADALRQPREGYAASPKFRPSLGTCPLCSAEAFIRIRHGTNTIIGAVCPSCPWLLTYQLHPPLPISPLQMPLPF